MTAMELIAILQGEPSDRRVVAEYDGGLYPVTGVTTTTIGEYPKAPKYDLHEGEIVCEITYEGYQ